MGKLVTFVAVMGGVTLLAYFFGLLQNTPNSEFLNFLLNPDSLRNAAIYTKIILIAEIVGVVGATIFSATQKTDFPIIALLIIPLLNFMWDFLSIYQVLRAENFVLATLLMSPFFFVYVLTVVEWWRGVDN